jgi:hypothetical protein
MKGSEVFKNTIKEYLDIRAAADNLFKPFYDNPDKNIDDCITYILNEVQRMGVNGLDDSEVYGMAVHYYQEETIDVGAANKSARVVVNHHVELSQTEIEQIKQDAIKRAQEEQYRRITASKKTDKPKADTQPMLSLFDE